ncbi:MAG: hypothetical protein U0795_06580 [Pirellulales bacterium]
MLAGKKLAVESLERREVFSASAWGLGVTAGDLISDRSLAVNAGTHQPGTGHTTLSAVAVNPSATDQAFRIDSTDLPRTGIIAVLIGL